jgi:hypothetical protein
VIGVECTFCANTNGSQEEQVDELCVGKDVPAEKAIRKMAIGEIRPQEED